MNEDTEDRKKTENVGDRLKKKKLFFCNPIEKKEKERLCMSKKRFPVEKKNCFLLFCNNKLFFFLLSFLLCILLDLLNLYHFKSVFKNPINPSTRFFPCLITLFNPNCTNFFFPINVASYKHISSGVNNVLYLNII